MPGVSREPLLGNLRDLHRVVGNARGGGQPALYAYFDWVDNAVRVLQNQISAADLDRLVLTRRYELLLSTAGRSMEDADLETRIVNGLLDNELDQRVAAFGAACEALERQIKRWSRPGEFVVADTSVYITHPDKLEEIDFAAVLGARELPIHLIVPVVVIDELDGLKQSKDGRTRGRARYTLAVLDRVSEYNPVAGLLRAEDFSALKTGGIPRGEVTVELLFDPPGHVRLPINDDEIIDRALAIEPLAGRPVTLLTYDTGQSTRARAAGLRVHKLAQPTEDELPGALESA
jgi:hypothetical protein